MCAGANRSMREGVVRRNLNAEGARMDDFDFYRLYKTLHVLSVIALGGGIAIETVIGPLMVKARSVQELRAYTRLSRIAENYVILPAVLFVTGFGYATAGRLNIDLETTWLFIAQILTLVAAVMSIGYLRLASGKINRIARETPEGPVPESVMREMKNPGPPIVGGLLTIVFVFIVYLMVAKPDW